MEDFQNIKSRRMNELRAAKEFCDLTLKSEDGIEIEVHKVIVSAASSYFRNLLTNSMKEKFDKCILLPYITGEILEIIISYVYTNEIDKKADTEKILEHAIIYQLDQLVDMCSATLFLSMNEKTCLKYWRFAKNILAYSLEKKCLKYIAYRANYLFENSLLNDVTIDEMKTLLADDRLECPEEELFDFVWNWAKILNPINAIEVFSEVFDLFRFSDLKDEFILSRILYNCDLLENAKVLKRIVEFTKHKLQSKNGTQGCTIFSKSSSRRIGSRTKKLLGLCGNEILMEIEDIKSTRIAKELPKSFACTTFGRNFFLICGGEKSKSCEYLEPITKEWKEFPSISANKSEHSCTYVGNKIYACGGCENNTVEIFDLDNGVWHNGPEMHFKRTQFGLSAVNGSLYAIGGETNNVEILDPRAREWCVVSYFPCWNEFTRCVSIGPSIYCFCEGKRFCFDTRMNKFHEKIEWTDFKFSFDFCELDGEICGFGYRNFSACPNSSNSDVSCPEEEEIEGEAIIIKYNLNDDTKSFTIRVEVAESQAMSLVALYY